MKNWVTQASAIISALSTLASALIYYVTLKVTSAELLLSSNTYSRDLPAYLDAKYVFPGEEEYLVIRNSGKAPISSVIVRRQAFFVSKDRALTARGLEEELARNQSEVDELIQRNIVAGICELPAVFGPIREYSIDRLDAGGHSDVEVSHWENVNSIKVAEALGRLFVVKWTLNYNKGPDDRRENTSFMFYQTKGNTRESVDEMTGGAALKEMIAQAEKEGVTDIFHLHDTLGLCRG